MTKITVPAYCGDAPKRALLRELNIAFARADVEAILSFFSDSIRWEIVGEQELRGKAAVRRALEAMANQAAEELVIHSIIVSGREGAINGVIRLEQGGAVAFCDICHFESAAGEKIKSMKSYAVEINDGG